MKFMAKDRASRHSPSVIRRQAGMRSARRPTRLIVTPSKMPEGSKAAPMTDGDRPSPICMNTG